ncbi:MAG TPA: hypothetical protein VNF47_18475 [Streptosporangiaceae bacterium]|nr:hypothetical protein [Streptosporangiaceae bacterium]
MEIAGHNVVTDRLIAPVMIIEHSAAMEWVLRGTFCAQPRLFGTDRFKSGCAPDRDVVRLI